MAYSTTQDLLSRITRQTLVQLTDTGGTGNVDETIVQNAVADSDSMINSMISPVYKVPLTTVPPVIKEVSAAMAIYRLHLYRSVDPGVWKDEYERALGFLQSVAEGKAKLEGSVPEPPGSADLSNSVDFDSKKRRFSRDELKEW
jgi:phage gp36-like protein